MDPVQNSQFVPDKIEQEIKKLYRGVTLSSIKLETHNDSTHSQQLTIENLLKRVEQLQLMDAKREILDNQQKLTSLSEDNASKVYHSKQIVNVERESDIHVSTSNSSLLPSRTEQQIEQNEKSDIGTSSGRDVFSVVSNIMENIVAYLCDAKRDAEQLLRDLFQREGKVNYDKLTKCLLNLKDAKWIENYQNREHLDIVKDVEKRLIEHAKEMKISIMKVSLNLDNYDKIESAYKLVLGIKEMKPLEKILPDINEHIVEANSWFEKEIDKVCMVIQSSFDIEELEKETEKRLDLKQAEKAFKYLEACKASRIPLHTYFLCVPNNLEASVRYYCDFVQKEMKNCFENIKQFKNENKENLFEKTRILSVGLSQVSEIKTTHYHIFSTFSNQRIVEEWHENLTNFLMELENQMQRLSYTKQLPALENKLLIASALHMLDSFLGERKFADIYSKFENELFTKINDTFEKVIDAIEKHDYVRVARGMTLLRVTNRAKYLFDQAKQELDRSSLDFIEEIKIQVSMIGNNLETEKIKSIVDSLKRIKEAKQFVSQYLSTPNVIETFVENIKSIIEIRLKRSLEGVTTLIKINNFYEAEQKIESIISVRNLLDQYCTPELFKAIDKISEHQRSVVLNEIIPKYENMDISRYVMNPPTDIFDKFGAAESLNSVYSQALDKIKEIIVTKFRKELDIAKNEKPPNPSNSHIRRFEFAVKYLPEDMKDALETELKYCKEDIELMTKYNMDELKNVISNKDLTAIKVYLGKLKIGGSIQSYKEAQILVLTQVIEIVDKIRSYLNENDVNGALVSVKELNEYQRELGNIVTDIKPQYSSGQCQIKIKFQDTYRCFMSIFLQNATAEIAGATINEAGLNFLRLIEFLNFREESKGQLNINDMFPEDFTDRIVELDKKTSDLFMGCREKYEDGLENMNIASLKETLDFMKRWDSLIIKMKNNFETYHIHNTFLHRTMNAIRELPSYSHMLKAVSELIQKLKVEIIRQQLINKRTKENSQQRNQFYRELHEKLIILDKAKFLSPHDLGFHVNAVEQECLKSVEAQITDIFTEIEKFLRTFIQGSTLTNHDYDNFNLYYNNILSI
ncbi:unnamed protein product [Rotaria magnacalcarata]|uniref:Uncharacterized protein n=1 Tax=Rotaria magnacalcarata TaxID=392030 RepID=A0A816DCL7_9BILA|nr:unnamed protein product [Rotaria magnacalcarata]CAF3901949.1 unnamed protein product [Rotaria magnacalcarata]